MRALAALAITVAAASLALTWWRLFRGADLADEAFPVLVPWRWALGDRPFVDEQNLSQSAGLLAYPFVKLFALLRGGDATGLMLYGRHLYLGLALVAALCVYLLARRSLPRPLAALVAAPLVTVVLFETPQLTPNTLCALSLSAGAALGAVAVLGGGRRYAVLSGVAFGLAGIAYPTVLLLTPFVAVFLAFSLGERGVDVLTGRPPLDVSDAAATWSGRQAWRALGAWVPGCALVVAPLVTAVAGLAGAANLRRCWDYTIALADHLDQLGGASKAVEVAMSFAGVLFGQWYIVLAAIASLALFRLRPGLGRWLLLLTPPAVWLVGTTSSMGAAGAVIMYALAAPYLYLFVPEDRREDGARLLIWVWAPALLIGAMTAYTSADGFEHAAVGLLPGVVVAGLFLAWGLTPLSPRDAPWMAVAGLAAVVAATLAFQVQFQSQGAAMSDLVARVDGGPWTGISLTEAQRRTLEGFGADLERTARPGDELLVYPQGSAFYLYWEGAIAANTYQLYVKDADAPLPQATVSFYRRRREAPTLVAHLVRTQGQTAYQLQEQCGGLAYPAVVIARTYALHRRPPGESLDDVLARLPRR